MLSHCGMSDPTMCRTNSTSANLLLPSWHEKARLQAIENRLPYHPRRTAAKSLWTRRPPGVWFHSSARPHKHRLFGNINLGKNDLANGNTALTIDGQTAWHKDIVTLDLVIQRTLGRLLTRGIISISSIEKILAPVIKYVEKHRRQGTPGPCRQ